MTRVKTISLISLSIMTGLGGVALCAYPFVKNPHDRAVYTVPKPENLTSKIEINMPLLSLEGESCHRRIDAFLPPEFPAEFFTGNTSGFCKLSFEHGEDGAVSDIAIIHCTHEILAAASIEALKKWRYENKNCPIPEPESRQHTTMRYDLMGEGGEKLPYP